MHLRSVYLHHFRNYDEALFEFSPRLNLVCGPNAQGKTSLLEAIYSLMTGRSFRSSSASDMIKQGAPGLYVESLFFKHEIEQKLKFYCDSKEKRILYNNTLSTTSSSLLGILQGAVMTPDDIALVKGGPQVRRSFLDMLLAQVDPLYVHHLTRYYRAMRQRNHLLRAKQVMTIESWEHEMASSAAYLTHHRAIAVASLREAAATIHGKLTGNQEQLVVDYKAGVSAANEQDYLDCWTKHRQREIFLGYTLSGPHKDDLILSINSKEVRSFASEGQQRCCAMALKLAEWERLRQLTDEPPLLLVDDIGLSLDAARRSRLMEHIVAHPGQIFLSTTDDTLLDSITDEKRTISLGK